MHLGSGSVVQKPTDESDPKPPKSPTEYPPHTYEDEKETKYASHVGGNEGGAAHVASHCPDDGAEHAAAIKGITRDQIEEKHCEIDVSEIFGETPQWRDARHDGLDHGKNHRQTQADNGARDGNNEFCSGAGRFGPNLRHPAEDEQCDAAGQEFCTAVLRRSARVHGAEY